MYKNTNNSVRILVHSEHCELQQLLFVNYQFIELPMLHYLKLQLLQRQISSCVFWWIPKFCQAYFSAICWSLFTEEQSAPRETTHLCIVRFHIAWNLLLYEQPLQPYLQIWKYSWEASETLIIMHLSLCVCVFGFKVAFNNFSVISRRYLVATGSSMLTFTVLPHWSIMS